MQSITDHGCVGDGSTDNQSALTAFLASYSSAYIPDGIYNHSGTIDWTGAGRSVKTESERNVVFQHTGSGFPHKMDGGTTTIAPASYGARIGPFRITGNSNSTDGFYLRNCHDWKIDITVNNVSGVAFRSEFAILGRLRVNTSPNSSLGYSPQLSGGIVLDGNTRTFDGQINNGTVGGGTSGNVLTVLASVGAPLEVGMFVTGPGVAEGTQITSFLTGTGGVGTYTVNHSQDVGGSGEVMGDNGVTGPSNVIVVERPIIVSTSGTGIYLGDAGSCTIESPEVESNGSYNILCGGKSANNEIRGGYSNGNILIAGTGNSWTNPTNGGTLEIVGEFTRIFGGKTTNGLADNTASNSYIRGLIYSGTFMNYAIGADIEVIKDDGTFPVSHSSPRAESAPSYNGHS